MDFNCDGSAQKKAPDFSQFSLGIFNEFGMEADLTPINAEDKATPENAAGDIALLRKQMAFS